MGAKCSSCGTALGKGGVVQEDGDILCAGCDEWRNPSTERVGRIDTGKSCIIWARVLGRHSLRWIGRCFQAGWQQVRANPVICKDVSEFINPMLAAIAILACLFWAAPYFEGSSSYSSPSQPSRPSRRGGYATRAMDRFEYLRDKEWKSREEIDEMEELSAELDDIYYEHIEQTEDTWGDRYR